MKVVYEPGEIASIEKSVEILKDNGHECLFEENNPDRLYGLTFKVTNPALAQYILVGLLNDHLEDFELGIEIRSIEFGPVGADKVDKTEIREKLHRAVEEILG